MVEVRNTSDGVQPTYTATADYDKDAGIDRADVSGQNDLNRTSQALHHA